MIVRVRVRSLYHVVSIVAIWLAGLILRLLSLKFFAFLFRMFIYTLLVNLTTLIEYLTVLLEYISLLCVTQPTTDYIAIYLELQFLNNYHSPTFNGVLTNYNYT